MALEEPRVCGGLFSLTGGAEIIRSVFMMDLETLLIVHCIIFI